MTGKYCTDNPMPDDSRLALGDQRILESEMREDSFAVASQISKMSIDLGKTVSQVALNWVLANKLITSAVIGPRTFQQYNDNLGSLDWALDETGMSQIDSLVPPSEHTGFGFNDPMNLVKGKVVEFHLENPNEAHKT